MSKIIEPIKKSYKDIPLQNVKGVLIDLDNTLYPYMPAHRSALDICFKNISSVLTKYTSKREFVEEYTNYRAEVRHRLTPQGTCRSRFFAFQALFEERRVVNAYELALQFEMLYWSSFINSMTIYKEAKRFLQRCKEASISVCLVTDMQAHFQVQKLKKLGIIQYINFLVSSEEIGVEKPDSRIFQAALKKIDLSPEEVIMIGDHYEKDVLGAEAVGIKGYLIDPEVEVKEYAESSIS